MKHLCPKCKTDMTEYTVFDYIPDAEYESIGEVRKYECECGGYRFFREFYE